MSVALVLSWRDGVTAAAAGAGSLAVQGPCGQVSLREVAPAVLGALRRLDPPGEREDRLLDAVRGDGNGCLTRWYYYLERLNRRGLICYGANSNATRLATLVPISSSFVWSPAQPISGRRYVLSRFAYMRRAADEAVLESPLTHTRVVLHNRHGAALVGALAASATLEELGGQVGGLSADAIAAMVTLLLRAGMLSETDVGEEDAALQTWEFHDLLFHARCRMSQFDALRGATYRLAGKVAPPPALKPAPVGEGQELYRPDMAQLERDDPSLTRVLERRCSAHEFDAEHPITARQLGEFLYRVGRVKHRWQAEVATDHGLVPMDFASRPYPAGGALYELELYAAVNVCVGLGPGLYYYDPSPHRLIRCCGRTADVGGLLRDAAQSTGVAEDCIQVLFIVAARFPRVAWKYESIAYALTLKHVGVVFQTMYLAATAMGLGPCAVGCGDAELLARAAGADHRAETSVGEFLLGSQRHRETYPFRSFGDSRLADCGDDLPRRGRAGTRSP